jgi:murein DD-endopeptidase MepM/ murein hydrolase activator NlpD
MKSYRAETGRSGKALRGALRRPRVFAALAVPLAVPLFLAAVRNQPEFGAVNASAAVPAVQLRYDELRKPFRAELPEHSLILTVEPNDTLDGVLTAGGLTRGESALLTREFGKSFDVRRLRPGHMVRFHYDQVGVVDGVQMKITGWGELAAVRNGAGFEVEARPAETRQIETTISATVDRSLYEAIRDAGEGPQLVQQLVDVFQWDIDFFELRRGDTFSFVVSKHFAGSDVVGYGPITAARFTHRGTTYEAFRHESADGFGGYYGRGGAPLRKQFLKAPLKFSRVTSGFSKRRFHPVLKYFRPHHGIDYGARVGTPVMTTADGVVVEARYKQGEGNFVRIRHSSTYDTYYLHLSRFAKGLKKGTKVTQGDVIGYVGMTGLATGPHLDYRVTERGKWLNPLNLKSITPDPLRGAQLARYRANVARLVTRLDLPPSAAVDQKTLSAAGRTGRALF